MVDGGKYRYFVAYRGKYRAGYGEGSFEYYRNMLICLDRPLSEYPQIKEIEEYIWTLDDAEKCSVTILNWQRFIDE